MDMKSVLTTLDIINKPKSADIIAEDEIEEELTLEDLEALEEEDELEEATVDDWYKAGGWNRTSRSQEETPGGGTLSKSTYLPQDKIDKAIDIVTDMANNATGAFHEILRVFGETLGEMLWNTEDVQSALEALEGVDEGIKVYTTNFEEGRYADIDTMLNEDRLDEVLPALAALGRGIGGLGLKYLQRHSPKLASTVKNALSKAKGGASKAKDGASKAKDGKDGAKATSVGATAGGLAKRAIKWVGKNPIKSYLGYTAIDAMTPDEQALINDAEQGIEVDFDELQKVIDKYKAMGLGESNELSRIKHLAGIEEGMIPGDWARLGITNDDLEPDDAFGGGAWSVGLGGPNSKFYWFKAQDTGTHFATIVDIGNGTWKIEDADGNKVTTAPLKSWAEAEKIVGRMFLGPRTAHDETPSAEEYR
jgi:hypothetical protein